MRQRTWPVGRAPALARRVQWLVRMVALDRWIDKLMSRLGFVRLGRYGLLLSPEDRILSLRPAIDDGMGGRIVGWRDADLVSAELHPWQATIPSLVQTPVQPTFAAPIARAPVAPPPLPPPAAIRAAALVSPVAAPPAAEPPEEDWEWTLAVARARAAAEASPTQPPVAAKTAPMRTVAPPRAASMTVPPPAPPEPAIESWDDQSCTALPPPPQAPPARTVIPVPSLTRGAQLQPLAYRPEPVVRAPVVKPAPAARLAPVAKARPAAQLASVVPLESRRFPRGTRPVDQDLVAANDDHTDTQIHAAPEHDTRTQVRAASVRAIPSIKQRMAGR